MPERRRAEWVVTAREVLGEAAYAAARAQGAGMTWESAMAFALHQLLNASSRMRSLASHRLLPGHACALCASGRVGRFTEDFSGRDDPFCPASLGHRPGLRAGGCPQLISAAAARQVAGCGCPVVMARRSPAAGLSDRSRRPDSCAHQARADGGERGVRTASPASPVGAAADRLRT